MKGKRLVLVAATPRLTTANSSECANRGLIFCNHDFCILYLHMCTFTCVHFNDHVARYIVNEITATAIFPLRNDLAYAEATDDDKLLEIQRKLDRFLSFFLIFNQDYVFFPYKHVKPIMLLKGWNDYTFTGSLQFDFGAKFIEVTWY